MNSTEPTYDELKQRVRALEEQNQNLHDRVNLLESVLDGIPDEEILRHRSLSGKRPAMTRRQQSGSDS